jgi:uncharacterized protein YndB with AHSA1/START domain
MISSDLSQRSKEIHWPDGFSPDTADMFAHNEIFINAPSQTVWRYLVEAEKWPEWYPNSQDVRIIKPPTGVLQQGSQFQWTTFGLPLVSEVFEFVPTSRLGWFGSAPSPHAEHTWYHTWFLVDEPQGCHVIMEEVGKGPGAKAMRQTDPGTMHKGHDLWNSRLKQLSEKTFPK